MELESLLNRKAEKETLLKSMLEKSNQLDQEKQNLLQEMLRIDGELRFINELISSGENNVNKM
jgi:hypothetical protein